MLITLPLTVGLAVVLYVVAVLLGRPGPVRPKVPMAADPVATASALDLDTPISHTVFQPPTTVPAPTPAIRLATRTQRSVATETRRTDVLLVSRHESVR